MVSTSATYFKSADFESVTAMVAGMPGRAFKPARVCSRFECTYFVVVSTRLCPPRLPLEELPRFGPDADLACVFCARRFQYGPGLASTCGVRPRFLCVGHLATTS
jgi:hypothetical protein